MCVFRSGLTFETGRCFENGLKPKIFKKKKGRFIMKSSLYFAILWVSISAVVFGYATSAYMANINTLSKEDLFIVIMSLLVFLTGVFFAVNYQKITLYLKNYKREKHI